MAKMDEFRVIVGQIAPSEGLRTPYRPPAVRRNAHLLGDFPHSTQYPARATSSGGVTRWLWTAF